MRIVSLVPNGTEILFALGLGDQVVGVSHECDYPEEARRRPVLTGSALRPGWTECQRAAYRAGEAPRVAVKSRVRWAWSA